MATAAVQAPPGRVPTPRSLPTRTSSPQSELVAAAKSSRNTSSNGASASIEDVAPSQQAAAPRRGLRTASAGPLSDRATAFLVRRILCPQQADKGKSSPASIEDILPPLTSRNDVDLQLYALIAIILREYVQNWYAKITPDATFVAEIVQIIAHITRALEQRLRKVDLESLLFDELPELLDRHITGPSAPPGLEVPALPCFVLGADRRSASLSSSPRSHRPAPSQDGPAQDLSLAVPSPRPLAGAPARGSR